MKITEPMRLTKALEMIEEASSDAQSTNPRRDWRSTHNALCYVYEIIHSVRSPKCRKNHPAWTEEIDRAIRAPRKTK